MVVTPWSDPDSVMKELNAGTHSRLTSGVKHSRKGVCFRLKKEVFGVVIPCLL